MIKLLQTVLVATMAFLSVVLCMEYMSLRHQVKRVVEIQEEYQTYTSSVRKILREYQRLKEGEEETSSCEDDEKKKEQTFVIVNREPEYLKEGTERYLRKHRLESSIEHVYPSEQHIEPRPSYRSKINRKRTRPARAHSTRLLSGQLARYRARMRTRVVVDDIRFAWPIDRSQFWISSFYGARRKPDRTWGFHNGIDMAAIKGTPTHAVCDGVIVEAGNNKGYGNTIVIMHNNKYRTRYAHLHRIYVRRGQSVTQGQCIGSVGDTGLVRKRGRYASHLHFEVYVYGKRVNPIYFFV
jgi:murein DD-endopeptidase MepM/ murein hydrolase activator NlpD